MTTRRNLLAGAAASLAAPTVAAQQRQRAVASSAALQPDHELLQICAQYERHGAVYRDVIDRQEALATDDPEWNRLDDIATEASLAMGDLETKLFDLHSQTPIGLRAKARVALLEATCCRGTVESFDRQRLGGIAVSLAASLAGSAA